jgi:hypothetical protein
MSTEDVLAGLHELEESPWADIQGKPLNARGLAQRVRHYGIKSTDVRVGDWNGKGYKRADLWDTWTRYLADASQDESSRGGEEAPKSAPESGLGAPRYESATSATSATDAFESLFQEQEHSESGPPFTHCQNPNCGNPLVWPDSQQRGNCSTCWLNDEDGAA